MRRVYELHKTNIFDTIKNALNILKPIVDSKPKYYENTIIKKEQSTITHRGNHLLIDCRNVPKETCIDDKTMLNVVSWAAETAGMEVISRIRYRFPEEQISGYTLCALLNESHISAHSYYNDQKISMDIFTCGSTDPEKVFQLIKSKIDLGNDITVKRVKRFF